MNYKSHVYEHDTKSRMNYLVYLPDNYNEEASMPLIISLHGSGERGTNPELIKKYGIHRAIKDNKEFPFIVVSPQCPEDEIWEMQFKVLKELLNHIYETYKVNRDKVYLTGYSLGGYGTWNFAILNPHLFAAIVPISGGAISPKKSLALSNLPIWTAHGDKDKTVDIKETKRIVDYLKRYNTKIVFKIYKDAGHEVCTKAYEDKELYKWLLGQSRKGN